MIDTFFILLKIKVVNKSIAKYFIRAHKQNKRFFAGNFGLSLI